MTGMNRETGRACADDAEHIRQSVRDILTTPVGSRLMRRDYGSLIPELIDQPGTPANRMRMMSATVMALIVWEPRIAVQKVGLDLDMQGNVAIDMDAVRTSGPRAGTPFNIAIPLR